MDRDIPTLPIAFRIDTAIRNTANLPKPGGYGVMYKCPNCGNPFYALMPLTSIKYCYNCGQAIRTNGVVEFLNSQMSTAIEERRKRCPDIARQTEESYLKLINEELNPSNKGRKGTVFIAEFEKGYFDKSDEFAICQSCSYRDDCDSKPICRAEKYDEGHREEEGAKCTEKAPACETHFDDEDDEFEYEDAEDIG